MITTITMIFTGLRRMISLKSFIILGTYLPIPATVLVQHIAPSVKSIYMLSTLLCLTRWSFLIPLQMQRQETWAFFKASTQTPLPIYTEPHHEAMWQKEKSTKSDNTGLYRQPENKHVFERDLPICVVNHRWNDCFHWFLHIIGAGILLCEQKNIGHIGSAYIPNSTCLTI